MNLYSVGSISTLDTDSRIYSVQSVSLENASVLFVCRYGLLGLAMACKGLRLVTVVSPLVKKIILT